MTKLIMKSIFLLLLSCIASMAYGQTTFSDGNFQDADWTSTVLTLNHPSTGGSTAHELSGGNPNEHRSLSVLSCAGAGDPCRVMLIEMRVGAIYDPSTQGPIGSLSYSEDQMCATADGCEGGGQAWYPALEQNGKTYVHVPGAPTGVLDNWTNRALSGLMAMAFEEVSLAANSITIPNSFPDFSVTGSPIQFGYARANSKSSARTGRIDNWNFSVQGCPGPSSNAGCLVICPAGDGPTLTDEGLGILVNYNDANCQPVPSFPFGDIWLDGLNPVDICWCSLLNADGDTDLNGQTTITGAPAGGGYSPASRVLVAGAPLTPSLDIALVSVDINCDQVVNLVDLGLFAASFLGAGSPETDFNCDQTVNLVDLGIFAVHYGHACVN